MGSEQRLLALAGLLRQSRTPLSRRQIADALEPVHAYAGSDAAVRKKLQRDLDQLEELGLAVRYDAAANGYLLERPTGEDPRVSLTPFDAALLREATALVAPDRDSAFALDLSRTLERLEVPDLGGAPPVVVHQPRRDGPDAADRVQRLCVAAWRRRPAAFDYTKPGSDRPERRALEPWGLFARQGRWYVVGHCPERGAARCFAVGRMAALDIPALTTGPAAFERPAGFDIAVESRRDPWRWAVHPPERLVLEVDGIAPMVARALGGRLVGGTVETEVTNAFGVWERLVEWAPRVRPLAPEPLADAWAGHVAALRARHAG